MLHVLYLVHDLADPAVRRRVMMLEAGGAVVTLAGFRRTPGIPTELQRLRPIDLGRTADGKFAQRLKAIAAAAMTLGPKLGRIGRPDVIIGRNLEMLALAARARSLFSAADIPIVYECLDIHRLLLGKNGVSRAMRGAERALGRKASLLLTSSPAFVRDYFQRFQQVDAPVVLLHNKVLELTERPSLLDEHPALPNEGEPWVIGWFGALRCRKSLELLAEFTRRMQGRFEIVLRGRPAYSEFTGFDGFVTAEPFMRFGGAYRNPEDLPDIYGAVHFAWAIDFFEEGLNSNWLLPNRLFEGCRYGAVPVAMRRTETGRFLSDRRMGVLLDEASPHGLAQCLGSIDHDAYQRMRGRICAEDRSTWVSDLSDCRALMARLAALSPERAGDAVLQAA
jgi:succinoglycan biosynthesis protein ExoL